MAGTRLALSIIYLIEIPLLVILALKYAVDKSSNIETKWYPMYQPFLPHSSGKSLLRKFNADDGIYKMRSLVHRPDFKLDVEFNLIFLGVGLDASGRDEAFHLVNDGVLSLNEIESSKESRVHAKILKTDDSMGSAGFGCDDDDDNKIKEITNLHQEGSYHIFIATGCQDSMIIIGEDGNIIVRLPSEDMKASREFLSIGVPSVINQLLYSITEQTSKILTHRLRIVVSVVDPDPSSHGYDSTTQIDESVIAHSHLLNQILADSMDKVQLMFEKLSPFRSITATIQNLPYHGLDLSSSAIRGEYDDGSEDFTLLANDVEDYLLFGDISGFTGLFLSPDVATDFNAQTMQWVLFVAEGGKHPLYVEMEGPKWGTAVSMPEKNLALSILNLPNIEKEGSQVDDEGSPVENLIIDKVYEREIQKAVSYFGTFLRDQVGLSTPQPHSDSTSFGSISIVHARAKNGVAFWEVDSLMRNTMHSRIKMILSTLEQVLELIHSRPNLSVSEKVCYC